MPANHLFEFPAQNPSPTPQLPPRVGSEQRGTPSENTEQQPASMADEGGAPSRNPNCRVTWEGCSVLLDINDGDRLVFARLSPSAFLKIGDKKCSLRPLVGCPFGSLFQVEAGPKGPNLVRVASHPSSSQATAEVVHLQEKDDEQLKEDSKDNRALLDDNKAQSLSGEDIDAMRRGGATGDEIIEALISSSSTFEKKTIFSQTKYRLRKQKKYAPRVLLRRPFARSICEAYFKKYPTRIGFLRVDTLSLLLSMANVSAYSDVLVLDKVGGIVTGAVAERLGGAGYVCSTYMGTAPYPIDIVRMFNFSSEICSRIVQAPLSSIRIGQDGDNESCRLGDVSSSLESHYNSSEAPNVSRSVLDDDSMLSLKEQNEKSGSTCEDDLVVPDGINENGATTINKSVNPGRQASPDAIKSWKQRGFTSLIIAAPDLDTWSIVHDLLPLLSYSAPFAIYHQYLQPLATCMHRLQAEKMAISLQISESWLREYQVLPSRTHPLMQMSGSGGYILSGIRVCHGDDSR